MADFNKPQVGDPYGDVLQAVRELLAECAKFQDGSSNTNVPTGAVRFSSTNKRFEKWNGSSWIELIAKASDKYDINVDRVDGYDAGNGSGQIPVSNGTVNTNLNADMIDGLDGSALLASRGSVAAASVDGATANGFYTQNNAGDSDGVLVFNPGGSLGPLQMRFKYTGLFEFRNKTDSSTWNGWKSVLHSGNYNSYSPTLTGTGASGTWPISVSGSAASAASLNGFTNSNSSNPISGPDSATSNGIGYVTGVSLFGQTDGGLFTQAYSASWVGQIYQDYRTGQLAVRGKNSGSWTAWNTVWSSNNFDPASKLSKSGDTASELYNNGWFRSNGNVGWYSQTYGGGIWMNDASWVRVYGSKGFLTDWHQFHSGGNIWTSSYGWLHDRFTQKGVGIENCAGQSANVGGYIVGLTRSGTSLGVTLSNTNCNCNCSNG